MMFATARGEDRDDVRSRTADVKETESEEGRVGAAVGPMFVTVESAHLAEGTRAAALRAAGPDVARLPLRGESRQRCRRRSSDPGYHFEARCASGRPRPQCGLTGQPAASDAVPTVDELEHLAELPRFRAAALGRWRQRWVSGSGLSDLTPCRRRAYIPGSLRRAAWRFCWSSRAAVRSRGCEMSAVCVWSAASAALSRALAGAGLHLDSRRGGGRRDDRIRLAELMAALSLATDLGLGRPLEHELGVCLAALELADRLGCRREERSDVYYVALLVHWAAPGLRRYFASWVGGDEIHFQRGVQVLGPASEPVGGPAVLRSSVGRRQAAARTRPSGRQDARREARSRLELMAANLCEGASLLAHRLRHARRGGPRARAADGALGR